MDQKHLTGTASEFQVAAHLLACGHEVYIPTTAQCRSDLVYEKCGRFVRVQVKTATWSKSGPWRYEQARLVSKGARAMGYTANDCDEIWIVGTSLWLFPISFAVDKTSVFLGSDNPNPRRFRRGYDADDYIVVRGSSAQPFRIAP